MTGQQPPSPYALTMQCPVRTYRTMLSVRNQRACITASAVSSTHIPYAALSTRHPACSYRNQHSPGVS
eukprot:3935064-Rhodomonas_salina.1